MKVQNEMSTRISVDTMSAVKSMSDFRNAISAVGNSWRAEERMLKDSGNTSEAVRARINGLNQVIDLQKAKIGELRQRQEGLDTSNQKQASQFFKLERQISQANKQLVNYQSQEEKARQNSLYYVSGLADLQKQYRLNDAVSKSFASSLRAQGKDIEADQRELKGLQESLSSLEKQQTKQEFLLKQVAHSSGETSEAYKKQVIQLNKTKEAIGNTKTKMDELNRSLNPPRISGWQLIRTDILHVDEAEQRARDHAISFGTALKTGILGGWVQQGFSSLAGEMKSVITNGMQVAKVGAAMEARWKNIGVSASGIKQLSAQVTELKTNTNLSAQAVNALQTRFYGMTHSVSQTTALTKGVASLADQLKLSDKQADAFAGGLSRIESSGKVASSSLGRLEKQAPGLTAAMSKASGMSQQAFKNLVSSGKMTSDQFNQILVKASKDYDANAKAFGQSSGGALHRLQQQWTTTQATFAKPLLKVSATGLNELNSALNNKDTQRGLQVLAKGLADAAVNAAKFIGYIAKHQTTVKAFALAVTGLFVAFKGVQTTVIAVDTLKSFIDIMGKAKQITVFSTAIKGIGTAAKIATAGFNPWIIAIEAVVAGFTLLYKHSKKFRNFVNGLVKLAQTGMKKVGRWFSSTFKQIGKDHDQSVRAQQKANKQAQRNWDSHMKSLKKGWNNFWTDYSRTQSRANQQSARNWENLRKNASRSASNMWKNISKGASNGWKNLEREANQGANSVSKHYEEMRRDTSNKIDQMRKQHPRTFGNMYKEIQDNTKTWKDIVTGHWNRLADDTAQVAKDHSATQRGLFSSLYDKLNDLTNGGLTQIKNFWDKTLNGIHDSVVNIGGTIHKAWDSLMNGVIDVFGKLVNGIVDGINWIVNKVGGSGNIAHMNLVHFAQGSNGPIAKNQLAVLNDAPDSDYREMIHKHRTGETFMMPAKRNILMPLEAGDEVLDGKRTAELVKKMGIPVPHANGAVGDFFSGIFDKVGDAVDDATDWVEKALKNVVAFGKSLFEHFTKMVSPKSTDEINKGLKFNLPSYFARSLQAWLKKQLDQLNTADPPGTGVERWRPLALRALKMLGLSTGLVGKVLRQIQTESGGNSKAMGGTDGLSDGHAEGLMQVKPPTFNAYKLPGHGNIWNGFDNMLAGLNYAKHRYGSDLSFLGQGHGYAEGGLITQHGIYEVGEHNHPEMIIPLDQSKRGRAYELLGQVISQFKREDSNGLSSEGGQEIQAMNRKFDALLSQNQRLISLLDKLIGVTDSANNPSARYKRTQKDINMAQYQSLI